MTPFLLAAAAGREDIARVLIAAGADANATNMVCVVVIECTAYLEPMWVFVYLETVF